MKGKRGRNSRVSAVSQSLNAEPHKLALVHGRSSVDVHRTCLSSLHSGRSSDG